jgi:hypothetical protein
MLVNCSGTDIFWLYYQNNTFFAGIKLFQIDFTTTISLELNHSYIFPDNGWHHVILNVDLTLLYLELYIDANLSKFASFSSVKRTWYNFFS